MSREHRHALSPRLARLKAVVMQRRGSFPERVNPFSRTAALFLASGNGKSRVQVRAAYLRELVRLATIEIEPDWFLAGQHLPTAHLQWQAPDPNNAEHLECLRQMGIADSEIAKVRDCLNHWQKSPPSTVGIPDPNSLTGKGYWGDNNTRSVFWAGGWIENHSIRDYAKVIRIGFLGVRREIEQAMAAADRAAPG